MDAVPSYLAAGFILVTLLTGWFFYKASRYSGKALWVMSAWVLLQSAIGLTGFYTVTDSMPPRFFLLPMPPVIFILILFFTKRGGAFLDTLDMKWLTLLHVVRIPVELILFGLFFSKAIPEVMTFEGRNFDILSGLTAPIVFYFGMVRKQMNASAMLIWNFICLGFLFNIVWYAVFSLPVPFQRFGMDQPNIALLYFPYVLLPAFVVPVVLLSHLVSIRQLMRRKTISAPTYGG